MSYFKDLMLTVQCHQRSSQILLPDNYIGCRMPTYLLVKVRNKLSALYSSTFTSRGAGAASLSFLNPRFSRLLHISSVDMSSTGILYLKKYKCQRSRRKEVSLIAMCAPRPKNWPFSKFAKWRT